MAGQNMAGQNPQNQNPVQQRAAHQQPGTSYPQQASYQENSGYNAAAYQQYYAQQYAAAQGYQQQAWSYGQYPGQYPQQAGWPQNYYPQQYAASYSQPQQQAQYPVQSAARNPAMPRSGNRKGMSCYNCGAKDHWAAKCPRPPKSAYALAPPAAGSIIPYPPTTVAAPFAAQTSGTHKGPVVTKYTVPPHVLAQMKARGVPGVATVNPNVSGSIYNTQYPGWQQQWPEQATNQMTYQHQTGMQDYTLQYVQAPQQYHPWTTPLSTAGEQPAVPTSASVNGSSATPAETHHATVYTLSNEHTVAGEKEEDKEEDTLSELMLLDVPDMPSTYGTPAYVAPRLVAKPLPAIACGSSESDHDEVNYNDDPNGRTEYKYIKHDDPEYALKNWRAVEHDDDPIFATIDVDTANIVEMRRGSRDSGRSDYETPLTFESGETRPTSIDEVDESHVPGSRRSSETSIYRQRNGHHEASPREYSRNDYRKSHGKKRRDSTASHDKKRKRGNGLDPNPWSADELQAKKIRLYSAPPGLPGNYPTQDS